MPRANMPPSNSPKASNKKKGCNRSIQGPHPDLYCQEHLAKPIYLLCNCLSIEISEWKLRLTVRGVQKQQEIYFTVCPCSSFLTMKEDITGSSLLSILWHYDKLSMTVYVDKFPGIHNTYMFHSVYMP